MKSIQNKILTVVISGLLVITAVVSFIAVNMTHEIMHTDADRILSNVTQKEAAYINDMLGDVKKSATVMEHYATLVIDNVEQLTDETYRAEYLEKTKTMFSEIALNTDGIKGYFFRLNPEYSTSTAGYYTLINEGGTIRDMKVTDLSKYPENDTQNVGWYYSSIKAGEALWLEPYYFPGYDEKLLSYTIPVYVNSELLGVIGFDIDFGAFVEKIDNISVYDRGYAVLLSADGKTCYNATEHVDSGDPHTKATVELQNGMFLELRADYKDIQKDIHPMLSRIVAAFIVVLVLAILYTIFVTRRIVRPLKQLTKSAEDIASGVGKAKLEDIPVNTKDEVGTLSRVLSSTFAKIQEYTTYINALAYRDSLTGIKNSTAYAETIGKLNESINLDNPTFGVLVADINNLKEANDRFGHDVGNELIIHAAKLLTDTFKTSVVYRIGGDEFAVILKDKDYDNYHALLGVLDTACAEDHITVGDTMIPVSMARGVAIFNPEIDRIYEDVFATADHAMYLNKQESKAKKA